MTSPKRIALVGAGNMGSHHARVIAQSEAATLSVLVDPREDVGSALAARFGATWAPELPDLAEIDGVVVAAATEAHFPLAMQVLGQNRPLLIEKPVADDLLRTKEILALADARDIPMMCGLLERFNPAVITAKAALNEPIHVTATRHSPYAPRIRTGVAWDLLVHDVDLAINIVGSAPTDVASQLGHFHPGSAGGAEDVAETLMRFESGALARISASRVGQHKIRTLSIAELDRLIEVDLLRRDVTIYRHVSENSVGDGPSYRQQTIIEIPEIATSQEPLTAQFARFMDVIDGRADAAAERASILPSHVVVDHVIAQKAAV
ncbi:gfo/Idh/MocA family oxidoreductase [Agromyces badenianii]|uniref:Gfo/Idh/MocA family oxidoreductase n=1 Tax=Agromyces badenianii TaxID=2080742 RepID=A0A2S0WX97_9MICO|nr:Gfo/Idh/MocA family oxidoreductase [Agromyces badenianii]AWB95900.1 gfo/Idh/MocA family oxidoreductase [Agromyces badenianii]